MAAGKHGVAYGKRRVRAVGRCLAHHAATCLLKTTVQLLLGNGRAFAFDGVVEGFGNEYFIKIYKDRLATDKRPRVKKYFRYFLGKLYLAEGKESEAINYFQQVLNDPDMDDPYQTMLTARVYEGLALASSGAEQKSYTQQLYARYPQLIPFSDLTMSFRLKVLGEPDEVENAILEELRDSRIEFVEDQKAPLVAISFTKRGEALDIVYSVEGSQSLSGVFRIEAAERQDAGKLLAYRLFNIQKSKVGERPPAQTLPLKKANEKPV